MSKQSQLDPQQLYDALVYSGPKWRPWLLWILAGAMGGVLGSEASTLVPGYRLWVIPLILILFYGAKNVYGLLDRAYTPISIQGTLLSLLRMVHLSVNKLSTGTYDVLPETTGIVRRH